MRRWKQTAIAVVLLILAAAGAAALFGPDLLRSRAREWVLAETGRTLEVGKISVNLLGLSVEVRDLVMTETDRITPFIEWARLYVALSPRSLWHRAPVIRELQLDSPRLRIERLPAGHFNFSDLLQPGEDRPPPGKSAEPARFSLNNLVVHGGRIEIIDRTLATPASHHIEALELAVPFVGNLPYLAERYVQPLLSATVNGTPFELKGELKPFADTQEYVVKLKFDGIDLPGYLGYLPEPLPVTVHSGRLDLDLDLSYRASAEAEPLLEIAGRVDLTTLDLREGDGRPLLFLPLLEARLSASHPLDQKYHLASVSINNLQGWLDRTATGEWNVVRLAGKTTASDEAQSAAEAESSSLQLEIDQLSLHEGRLELRDQLAAGGFATTLKAIDLDVHGFTLARDKPFQLVLGLATERQERLGASGKVTINPLGLDLAVEAKGVPLAAYQPYYQDQTAASIGGILEASTQLRTAAGIPLLLSDTRLEIHDLDLPLPDNEGLKLASAILQGGRFDLAARRLEVADTTFAGADLRFSRGSDGRWSFLDRNYPLLTALFETTGETQPTSAGDQPLSYRFGRIALHGARVVFRDELPAKPALFTISDLTATIQELAAPEAVPGSFAVQGRFQKEGRFRVRGSMVPGGPEVNAALQLQRIPLASFAPYLGERVRLVLVDGILDANLTTAAARQGETWRGRLGGHFGVSRFYCLDSRHREDLLRWERLQVDGIDARLDPLSVRIASVTLNDYFARVLLDEQAQLNLVEVFAGSPAADDGTSSTPAEPVDASKATPLQKPQIQVDKITLQGGKVSFTDRHLSLPFTANMYQLGGRIEGLTSAPGARAEVDLRGRLRNESPLTIAGTLNPLADPLFLDLTLDFTGIELSPLSPYSGTYVGYLIEKGKLNVALSYLVENGRLTASNKLFLDQFTFGAAVESDRATTLPVRLAVSLLKDRKGEIHLDIPVSGNLDDPQFSVWRIVWQVIRNLLVKAATSPLALLGALAGGGEDLDVITFPPGSADLAATEQAKLARIAEALRDRGDLKIEVKGYIDPDQDPENYRRELLQARLRHEKFIDLRKRLGEGAPADAEDVTVTPEEYPEYLWRVYKATDFPKPRNLVWMVKHLPDPELEKLLMAHTRVGNEELTALAQARSRAVATALVETGGLPRERVFLASADITAEPATKGVSRSRVELGIAVK